MHRAGISVVEHVGVQLYCALIIVAALQECDLEAFALCVSNARK